MSLTRYAPWKCRALITERAAVERARDARVGHLADQARQDAMTAAVRALHDAEQTHRAATGCTDNH